MSDLIHTKASELASTLSFQLMAIDDLDSQIKELTKRKKAMQKKIDDAKDFIRNGMAENGITRIECDDFLFRLDPPVKILQVNDESLIDDKFFKTVRQLDKTAVKKAIEVDGFVDGAEIVDGKNRLMVQEK